MAGIDFEALRAPISATEPCGPDLDLEGDPDFLNYTARSEGLLPTSFFAFDRASLAFAAEYDSLARLLGLTRDLRLLAIAAKLLILNRDLAGFADALGAIAWFLEERWDDVHPRVEDGDATLRMAVLATLDDLAPVVLPLQHAPLVESRRYGAISYRSQLVAAGEVKAREGEDTLERTVLDAAFKEADLPGLIATRERLGLVRTSLAAIQNLSIERAGYEDAVQLERLPALAERMFGFVEAAVVARDPSAASAGAAPAVAEGREPAPGETPFAPASAPALVGSGRIQSVMDVQAALAAVTAYFERSEPSCPAVLLVRQAEQLVGKSFLDAVRLLVPSHAEQATIRVGEDYAFDLSAERLQGLDASPSTDEAASEPFEQGGLRRLGEPSGVPAPDSFDARTRPDALALLQQVGAYYRRAEPSSPIPLLTDRARGLAERDFMSLLRDFLPEESLRSAKSQK